MNLRSCSALMVTRSISRCCAQSKLQLAVQRGLVTEIAVSALLATEDVTQQAVPQAAISVGEAFSRMQMGSDKELMVALVEMLQSPHSLPPPAQDDMPDSIPVSATVGLIMQHREVDIDATNESGFIGRTVVRVPGLLTEQKVYCFTDSQCAGPKNAEHNNGTCGAGGRCICPLPWGGARCDRRLECRWYHRLNGWQVSGCTLKQNVSFDPTDLVARPFVCDCAVVGSLEVLVVEAAAIPRQPASLWMVNPIDLGSLGAILASSSRYYTVWIVLGIIDGIWLLVVLFTCLRSDEAKIRRAHRVHDFWREQHENRVKHIRYTLRERIWANMKTEHSSLKCIYMKFGVEKDPSLIMTGAQKATVVYIVVLFEALILSMIMETMDEDDYAEASFVEILIQEVIMAIFCAILCEPALGVMNALFEKSQRVTNFHERFDEGSLTTALVRTSLIGLLQNGEMHQFFTKWYTQLETIRVDEIRTKLLDARGARNHELLHNGFSRAEGATSSFADMSALVRCLDAWRTQIAIMDATLTSTTILNKVLETATPGLEELPADSIAHVMPLSSPVAMNNEQQELPSDNTNDDAGQQSRVAFVVGDEINQLHELPSHDGDAGQRYRVALSTSVPIARTSSTITRKVLLLRQRSRKSDAGLRSAKVMPSEPPAPDNVVALPKEADAAPKVKKPGVCKQVCASLWFWRIFPWAFTLVASLTLHFWTIVYSSSSFAFSSTLTASWLQMLIMSIVINVVIVEAVLIAVATIMTTLAAHRLPKLLRRITPILCCVETCMPPEWEYKDHDADEFEELSMQSSKRKKLKLASEVKAEEAEHKGKRASVTVAALPVAALPAAPQPAHSRVGEGTGSNEGTAKADKDPPPPTEHVVADSVFSIVAGPRADSISIAALSKWLIQRGDIPLDKIQALFSAMDTDGNGSIDRQEWRVGFTAGLVQND